MNAETVIQNQIRCELSKHGICFRMNTGYFRTDDGRTIKCGMPGMPDLIFVGPEGQTVWIEVKTATGSVQPDQKRFMARLREMGHQAGIARNVAEALKLIGRK